MGKLSSAERIAMMICATSVVLSFIVGAVLIAIRVDGQISQEVVAGLLGALGSGVTAAVALIMHANSARSAADMAASIFANMSPSVPSVPATPPSAGAGTSASI